MLTLARNFWTRLPPMEGVADACATGRRVRSAPRSDFFIRANRPYRGEDAVRAPGRTAVTRWNDAFRASFELLSQAPALRQGQELGQTEIQPPVPAARRAAYQEMKRGSEEGDEAKEAKKPKEEDKAPAPAPSSSRPRGSTRGAPPAPVTVVVRPDA